MCHQILYLRDPSNRHLCDVKMGSRKIARINMQTHTDENITGLRAQLSTPGSHRLLHQRQIRICIQGPRSISYPSHAHAHRVTLEANQMLKGFSLGQKKTDWCVGTTDCAVPLPSNYRWSTTCPQSHTHTPSQPTAHKTCFHTAVYSIHCHEPLFLTRYTRVIWFLSRGRGVIWRGAISG